MHTIHEHQTNLANDRLEIEVTDAPGSGGASHRYVISGFDCQRNPSALPGDLITFVVLNFQNGPINEVGVNGVTHEALLAIVADRLRCFQGGPYACWENAMALTRIQDALAWLHHRTRSREKRGVEGTHEV